MNYLGTYYLVYGILLLLTLPYFFSGKRGIHPSVQYIFIALLVVIVSCYFGFRGTDVGSDTVNYVQYFSEVKACGSLNDYLSGFDYQGILFYSLLYFAHGIIPFWGLSVFFSLLFFTSFILLASVYFEEELFVWFINILGLFFVISLNINIIRTGFALSLFFLFLFFREKKSSICWGCLMAAVLGHILILLPISAYFISKWIKPTIVYYALWLVSLVFAVNNLGLLDISLIHFEIAKSQHFSYYLTNPLHYKTGFRPEFTAFNFIFIVLGYFAYRYRQAPYYFRMYLLLSVVFLALYGLPFSDRIGIFSWIFIPFIAIDFSQINIFKNWRISYWVCYLLILALGTVSFFVA